MHRFYVSSGNISAKAIVISDRKDTHHIKDVLRLKVDEPAVIFDESGNEYRCVVKELLRDKVYFTIREKYKVTPKAVRPRVTIACAIPRHNRMDEIVDKLTQLGVERIIPLETERVVVKLDRRRQELRLERWRKIAASAAKQSQRNNLPLIEQVQGLKDVLIDSGRYGLKLIAALTGKQKSLKEALRGNTKEILALVGPEGDFTPAEIELAKSAGCIVVSLGDLVLRVDTAAAAIAGFIRLYEES